MKTNLAKNIGEKIKFFREKHLDVSQEELADRAHVHVTHLSRLENGTRLPTIETLLKICDGLKVHISEILPGEKKKPGADAITEEILRLIAKRSLEEKRTILKLLKTYYSGKP
jgi:transcriptional regulator with XRE-family HTH domain